MAKGKKRVHLINSKAVFHVPNTKAGQLWLRQARDWLNLGQPVRFRALGRGPVADQRSYQNIPLSNARYADVYLRDDDTVIWRSWRNSLREKNAGKPVRWWVARNFIDRVERYPIDAAAGIEREANSQIRQLMVDLMGFDRYLLNSGAEVVDTRGEYQLLVKERPTEFDWQDKQRVVALKMTCPSTGAVYVSPVDPWCQTVAQALDWMYDVKDYLGRLAKEA